MLGKRLYLLLGKFSKREQEQLDRFMESAFFTSDTQRKLYQAIQVYQPNYETIDPPILFSTVFPKENYHYKKLKDLYADLVKKVELFLSVDYLKNDKYQLKKLRALAYRKRGDAANFEKASKAVFDELDKELDLSSSFEKLAIYNHNHYFPFETKSTYDNIQLITINDFLDETYVINKLRYYCEILSSQSFFTQKELPFQPEVFAIAEILKHKNPLIDIYLNLIRLIETKETKQFFKTYQTFLKIQPSLNLPESAIILTLLLNFTMFNYFQRDKSCLTHQFELQKLGIENGLFSIFTDFSYANFLNIIVTGVGLNQLDFVKMMIDSKTHLLPKEDRKACKNLGYAYYYFAKGEFEKANKLVLVLHKTPLLISLRARLLALRCLFEFYMEDSEYYQTFLSDCNKFKRYISRLDMLSENKKMSYINHMEILKDLAKYFAMVDKDQNKLKLLLLKIEDTQNLIGWEALQNKVIKIMNKNKRR